jgi:ketosteroid isomerase-like protein
MMKRLAFLIIPALISPGYTPQLSVSQTNQDGRIKVKSKRGSLRATDKSKPVRRALEAQYAKIAQANESKDLDALLALRAPDFSAKFPDGKIANSEQMAVYSRALFEQIQPPISVSNTIKTLTISGNVAVAVVHQRFSRMQVKAGQLRKVETEAIQRETWVLAQGEWKLKFVDDVRPGAWYVDGKRVDPSKPYDPNAPAYNPNSSKRDN